MKREDIIRILKEADAESYRYPTCEYRVYIDTDGDLDYEEWVAGSTSWYQFRDGYDREYIHTFCNEHFDIMFDYWFNGIGEFESAFEERFGFKPENDPDRSHWEDGACSCEERGISNYDYEEWLEEQQDEAIECIQCETDYDEIIDAWLQQRWEQESEYGLDPIIELED